MAVYRFPSYADRSYQYVPPRQDDGKVASGRFTHEKASKGQVEETYGGFRLPCDKIEKKVKWKHVKSALLAIAKVGTLLAVSSVTFGLPIAVFAVGGGLACASMITLLAEKVFSRLQINIFNPKPKKSQHSENIGKLLVDGNTEAHVCANSKESFAWKKRLIRSAEKNIVLSGNYCGGSSFTEILKILDKKMNSNSRIKVCLLSSTRWWDDENKALISSLKSKFSDRFALVETDDMWQLGPSLKKVTNHTKSLSIDNGKYFLLGGSGLEDKYALYEGVGDRSIKVCGSPSKEGEGSSMFSVERFMPRGFRDMDFVFRSGDKKEGTEYTAGQHLHYEVMKLANLWENMHHFAEKEMPSQNDVVIKSMMQSFSKDSSMGRVEVPILRRFFNKDCDTRIYATGPEQSKSPFLKSMIDKVNNAKKEIYIDQMYFHPPQELFDAFVNAANRGVKVNILTNGVERFTPGAHRVFGPRNRYNYTTLYKALAKGKRGNLNVWEYGQKHNNTPRNTTLHKKMVIVDDYVIAGSGNMGYKSLETMSDYEINFITHSPSMAKSAQRVFRQDCETLREAEDSKSRPVLKKDGTQLKVPLSRKVDLRKCSLWRTAFMAGVHRLNAPLIG